MREGLRRLVGLLGLSIRRTHRRLLGQRRRQFLLSVVGVAIAIGLVVTVTGVSIGLATNTSVYGGSVDYWIVPESASASTMAVSVGSPALGDVHATSDRIERTDGVENASPVAIEVVRLTHENRSEYVVLAGVLGKPGVTVLGADAGRLTPGDPHYADGEYTGSWTGEMVASPATMELLDLEAGATVTATDEHAFEVIGVTDADVESGAGSMPTAVVHLAELQRLSGGMDGDVADQLLVETNDPAVEAHLETIYPNTEVVSRSSTGLGAVSDTELPLAVALTGFLVAVIVGALFVATAMGMEVTADRASFATLQAVGVSRRSQLLLVAAQTVTVTGVGGLLGVALGGSGIWLTNHLAQRWLTAGPVATFEWLLLPYAIGLSVLMGLLAVPYLAWLTGRTNTLDQLEA